MTHDEIDFIISTLQGPPPTRHELNAAEALLRRLRDERDGARARIEELEKALMEPERTSTTNNLKPRALRGEG